MGGTAAILYGVPRSTFDLDIIIDSTTENAERFGNYWQAPALKALTEAGLGTAALTSAGDLLSHEISIFQDYVLLDVQTSSPGVDFDVAWANKKVMKFGDQQFYLLSRSDLIKSKRAAGRQIDLQDVEALEAIIAQEND